MSHDLFTVSGTIIGAERLENKLSIFGPAEALKRMRATVRVIGYLIERNVKGQKLAGGVLNRRSGRLARSINTTFSSTATSETSSTGTNLSYGRIWELTGSRAFTMVPSTKKALFWPGALHPVRAVQRKAQGPRPFLKPALQETKPIATKLLAEAMKGI